MMFISQLYQLFVALNLIAELIPSLLNKGAKYIQPGEVRNDRLEGEFGLYRQQSGELLHIC